MHTPLDKAAGFRTKADECHQHAVRSASLADKGRWLDMASTYLRLAQEIEERERAREQGSDPSGGRRS